MKTVVLPSHQLLSVEFDDNNGVAVHVEDDCTVVIVCDNGKTTENRFPHKKK